MLQYKSPWSHYDYQPTGLLETLLVFSIWIFFAHRCPLGTGAKEGQQQRVMKRKSMKLTCGYVLDPTKT